LIHLLREVGPVACAQAHRLRPGRWRARRLGSAVRIPVVGMPGENAALTTRIQPGYLNIAPADWRNEITVPGRWGWRRTGEHDDAATAVPGAVLHCHRDVVVPPGAMEDGARRGATSRGEALSHRHFEIYVDEGFENASRDQTEFFVRVLKA